MSLYTVVKGKVAEITADLQPHARTLRDIEVCTPSILFHGMSPFFRSSPGSFRRWCVLHPPRRMRTSALRFASSAASLRTSPCSRCPENMWDYIGPCGPSWDLSGQGPICNPSSSGQTLQIPRNLRRIFVQPLAPSPASNGSHGLEGLGRG